MLLGRLEMSASFDIAQTEDPRSFRTGFDKRAPRIIAQLRPAYEPDDLLTRARVANETDTSFQTWELLAHRKRGPIYKFIGAQAVYRVDDLIAWLEVRAQVFLEKHPRAFRPVKTLHAMENEGNERFNNRAEVDA
jgi:hypothetical protein